MSVWAGTAEPKRWLLRTSRMLELVWRPSPAPQHSRHFLIFRRVNETGEGLRGLLGGARSGGRVGGNNRVVVHGRKEAAIVHMIPIVYTG
jgi:hypothetical protein